MTVAPLPDTSGHQRVGENRSGSTNVLAVRIAAVAVSAKWFM